MFIKSSKNYNDRQIWNTDICQNGGLWEKPVDAGYSFLQFQIFGLTNYLAIYFLKEKLWRTTPKHLFCWVSGLNTIESSRPSTWMGRKFSHTEKAFIFLRFNREIHSGKLKAKLVFLRARFTDQSNNSTKKTSDKKRFWKTAFYCKKFNNLQVRNEKQSISRSIRFVT